MMAADRVSPGCASLVPMIRRQYYRPLGLLLLVVQVWMAGASAACHNHLERGRRHDTAAARAAFPGTGLTAGHNDSAPPCAACTYLKAVRGAAMAPRIHPTLPGGHAAVALNR